MSQLAMLGGAGLSMLGQALQAPPGRQMRRAYDERAEWTEPGRFQLQYLLGGMPAANLNSEMWKWAQAARQGQDYTPDAGVLSAFDKATGGPALQQMRNLAAFSNKRGRQVQGRFRKESSRLADAGAANLARVDSLAAGAEGIARQYGRGREGVIRSDAGQRLTDMDDAARGALAASGLSNSSAVADRLTGNRRDVGRETDRALTDLNMAVTDRVLGARNNRTALNASLGESNLNRDYQRSGQDTQLALSNLMRNLGLRQAPINTMLSTAQSPVANPMLEQGMIQPNASGGLSNALVSGGGALAGFGAQSYGQEQQMALLKQLMG